MDCSHSLRLQLQNKVSHLKHPENLSASICSIWLVLKENSKHREKHLKFGNNNFLQIYFPKEARSITFVGCVWSVGEWDGKGWSVTTCSHPLSRDGDGACRDSHHHNLHCCVPLDCLIVIVGGNERGLLWWCYWCHCPGNKEHTIPALLMRRGTDLHRLPSQFAPQH